MNVTKDKVLKDFVTKNETEEPTLENNAYTVPKYIHRLYNLNFVLDLTGKLIVHEYVNNFAYYVFDNDILDVEIIFNEFNAFSFTHLSKLSKNKMTKLTLQ